MNQKSLLLTEAVNMLLTQSSVPSTLTVEQCAVALAMSMTSFRRKLSYEETTFKLIQQKFLNELCVDALLTNHVSIDSLVIKLGYSERATFERAFRHKFDISPAQFRELSRVGDDKSNKNNLSITAQNMPPLSDSCQQLIREKDQNNFDLQRLLEIIAIDPIFIARLMGLASKAIYGKTPNTIEEAISRNLGVNTVINLAVIYSLKDALADYVDQDVINQSTHAFLMAPKFFQLMRKCMGTDIKFDNVLIEQVLVFAPLGILLLCHKNVPKHRLTLYSLKGIDDLNSLNQYIQASMNTSIFAASTLMLSLWHIDAKVIKQINHLDKVSKGQLKGTKQDDLVLFMLSCLYVLAAGKKEYTELRQKAELLNLEGFSDVMSLLFEEI
jgi:HD-like signal output (HDOD) protein/AraC-like DNA-binding protein